MGGGGGGWGEINTFLNKNNLFGNMENIFQHC
jgi:hypothetical protein